MSMKFAKAQRKKAKLRLGITGPSGSGKTWGALLMAKGLGGTIAVLDTEKGSASLYAGMPNMPEFDVLELAAPYTPERYIEAVNAAQQAGYDTLIIDSITHEWSGVGGCLELVDEVARAKFKGNSWSAWNEVTPRHRALLDAILQSQMHIIVTLRSKTETAQTEEGGRKKVVKLGMKSEQRDGFEYEMTTVLDLTHDGHYALASKDRTSLFVGDPKPITPDTGRMLKEWLETGTEQPAPPPPPPPMEEATLLRLIDSIKATRDEKALNAERDAAMAMCSESHDRTAAERVSESVKAHRKWIRAQAATNSTPAT